MHSNYFKLVLVNTATKEAINFNSTKNIIRGIAQFPKISFKIKADLNTVAKDANVSITTALAIISGYNQSTLTSDNTIGTVTISGNNITPSSVNGFDSKSKNWNQ